MAQMIRCLLSAACSLLLAACAAPEPFYLGEQVETPHGCVDYTQRGGFCSLQAVLDVVHERFEYRRDWTNHGRFEHWNAGSPGDCEDFALLVRQELNRRGIHGTRLIRAKTPQGQGHVFLELDGWLMDNQNLFPMTKSDFPGWRWLMAGDENGIWRRIEE